MWNRQALKEFTLTQNGRWKHLHPEAEWCGLSFISA